MATNKVNNFKEIADRVIQIKQLIENNYFLISNKIQKIMSSSNDKKLIDHCLHKQKVLDDGISQISALLEKIAARYYINIESQQNEFLKTKEKQLLEKISYLEKEAQKRENQQHNLIDNADVENNFDNDNLNEIKDLRSELNLINKAIENNEYELSGFDSIGFEDFATSVRKIASENEALKDQLVEKDLKDEFFKQQNIDVMNSLISSLNSAQSQSAKLAVFRDFMHKYSNDDATLNAEACYYIPTDSSLDSMVTEFADASRDIYDNGNGTVGTITGWVETEYGYHIIMYTGTPTNVDANGAIDVVLSALNNYYLNPVYSNGINGKTMLDKVIEQVTLTSYSTLESNILDAIKANKDIVTSESVYSDLYS